MSNHPMVTAFLKAFKANGGKEWAGRFNRSSLDQAFRFGYKTVRFRIQSASTVSSWDQEFIPVDAGKYDIVMIPDVGNLLSDWLACDQDAKAEYARFIAVVNTTFAPGE